MDKNNLFEQKVKITGRLVFETAFHIGSGREGELATDMGVLLESDGTPILPGSTLKGAFRAFAERLAGYLNLSACLLDSELSGVKCVSDATYRRKEKIYEEFKKLKSETHKIKFLEQHVCDVCHLFGSPLHASRIFFNDGRYLSQGRNLQIRDGVCIDRDTETARHGAKYDFEAVPRGAEFEIAISLENPSDEDCALAAAALAEWEHGFRLGGFTSRGLGWVQLKDRKVQRVDYTDTGQLQDFLLKGVMREAPELLSKKLATLLNDRIESC